MGSASAQPPHHQQAPAYGEAEVTPSYLPPAPEYLSPPQQPAPRKKRPLWKAAPATHILIAINCVVFLYMLLNGVDMWRPQTAQLLHYGADHAGLVLLFGEWWRVVTAMFVHVGLVHLGTNMWCLWNLGLLAEPLVGTYGLLAVYILTGAAGNMLSIFKNWYQFHELGEFPAGAGASGAVFGIAGVLILLLRSKQLPVPQDELRKLRRSVLYFAGINLAIGFSISFGASAMRSGMRIDNMAHLGGFCCGMLFATPLMPRIGTPRLEFNRRFYLATAMVIFLLVLFGFFLVKFSEPS